MSGNRVQDHDAGDDTGRAVATRILAAVRAVDGRDAAITPETLAAKYRTPTMTIGHWSRFTCNLPTRSDFAAIQEKEWFDAGSAEKIPEGAPIWLGLDVAWKWDTTAAVPLWWRDSQFRLLGPASILVPPRDGSSMHPSLVERMLTEIHERNPLHTIVMDTSRAEQLATWISDAFGATVIDGAIMVAGGEVFEPVQALDTVEMIPPGDLAWLRSVDLPMGLHGNPLVALDDRVYLPGGSIEAAAVDNPGQLFFITP